MKQFLTFLFIWLIPILSNATVKTNTIAGDLVNSLSSRTCNCYFFNKPQEKITALDYQNHQGRINFGNNSLQNDLNMVNDQWSFIGPICLLIFGAIFSTYVVLQVIMFRKRIRN